MGYERAGVLARILFALIVLGSTYLGIFSAQYKLSAYAILYHPISIAVAISFIVLLLLCIFSWDFRVHIWDVITAILDAFIDTVGSLVGYKRSSMAYTDGEMHQFYTMQASLEARIELIEKNEKIIDGGQVLTREARAALNSEIGKITQDDLKAQIREKGYEIYDEIVNKSIEQRFDNSRFRLEEASKTVTVRGFFNLIFGLAFAGVGIWYLISAGPQSLTNPTESVIDFILSKFSISILCVIVAYFFFSLYKTGLDDTKYYQNEMSNIDTIQASIVFSIHLSDAGKELYARELLQHDRNRGNIKNSKSGENSVLISEKVLAKIIGSLSKSD